MICKAHLKKGGRGVYHPIPNRTRAYRYSFIIRAHVGQS